MLTASNMLGAFDHRVASCCKYLLIVNVICNLFTHGTPGVHKNSFEMPVHSGIELEFGNVGF